MISHIVSIWLVLWLQNRPIAAKKPTVLASRQISMEKRYNNAFVNDVFNYNILLTIRYTTKNTNKLILKPGETFAFHNDVLPKYDGKVSKTPNVHFSIAEGFKSDGFLAGDGVCHLASLLYWVAKEAGLQAEAPTRHDFAPVPDVPREYGVSIYSNVEKNVSNQLQNLYISNTKSKAVAFVFNYDGKNLAIKAIN